MFTLRPYQRQCLEAVLSGFQTYRSQLVVMATGCGKTCLFATLAAQWEGGRVLVLAHRAELISQAAEKIHAVTGKRVGVEMAQQHADDDGCSNIVVGSVQTMCQPNRLSCFEKDEFGLIITDESHHATCTTYRRIYDYFEKARHLGVTATPQRADEQALGQIYEHCCFDYGIEPAIADGWLVPVRQRVVQCHDLDFSQIRTVAGDFNEGQLEEILMAERHLHEVAKPTVEIADGRQGLIFCVTVEHARRMSEVLNRYQDGSAAFLSGETPKEQRAEIVDRFRCGSVQFLCNCIDEETEILTTGGWKKKDGIHEGDSVASMVTSTGKMEWVPVLAKVERPRGDQERMVSLETPRTSFRVTEGHRMAYRVAGGISWKIDTAYQLATRKGRFQIPMACTGQPDFVEVPPGVKRPADLSLAECRFIGLFVSDGHLGAESRGVEIGQSRRNQWVIDEIISTLTECGFDWKQSSKITDRSSHEQVVFRIPRGNIGGALKRSGWDHLAPYLDKHGSHLWWGLTREQWLAFVEGLWLGDGVKARKWEIVNTDLDMLNLVQAICVCRGLAASLSGPRDNGPLATRPIYTLCIRDRSYITTNLTVTTQVEHPAYAEHVWCVSNRNGTIITRRHGKVVVMGQCALFTEGFDAPNTQLVVMARPTKSLSLYMQIMGRMTRPLPGVVDPFAEEKPEKRRAAIAASAKPSGIVLDFAGNAGRHKIVTAADVLGGKYSEEVRAYARATTASENTAQLIEDALVRAEAELALLQEEAGRLAAIKARRASYHVEEVSPFDSCDVTPEYGAAGPVRGEPVSEKQIRYLRFLGVSEHKARSYTKKQASVVIDKLVNKQPAQEAAS